MEVGSLRASRRVLVCSPNILDEAICAFPAVQRLTKEMPERELAWLAPTSADGLFEEGAVRPHLFVWPRRRSLPQMARELRQLMLWRADTILDGLGGGLGDWLAWLTRVPSDRVLRIVPDSADPFSAYLRPLAAWGVDPSRAASWPTSQSAARIEEDLAASHLTCGFLALHVGCGDSAARLARSYGRIARDLGRLWRLPSLALYRGAHERHFAEALVARSGGHALLAPDWNWLELGVVLQRAEAILSQDKALLRWGQLFGARLLPVDERDGYADEQILAQCEAMLEHSLTANDLRRAA